MSEAGEVSEQDYRPAMRAFHKAIALRRTPSAEEMERALREVRRHLPSVEQAEKALAALSAALRSKR